MSKKRNANFKAMFERYLGHSLEMGTVETLVGIRDEWKNAHEQILKNVGAGKITPEDGIVEHRAATKAFKDNSRAVLKDADYKAFFELPGVVEGLKLVEEIRGMRYRAAAPRLASKHGL